VLEAERGVRHREFNIQLSNEGKTFTTVASSTGAGFVEERSDYRDIIYFDGRRQARLLFEDGKLLRRDINRLLDLRGPTVFAGSSTSTCGSRSSSAVWASSCISSAAR
jgi:hypothetical protein